MDLKTRIRSRLVRTFSSVRYLDFLRAKARLRRKLARQPAAVHYFHQVDDPYSHLAIQKLDQLQARYNLPFEIHLVSGPTPDYQGSSEHFYHWALRDALSIAEDFGTSLSATSPPSADAVKLANDMLAPCLDHPDFPSTAIETGEALWSGKLGSDSATDQQDLSPNEGSGEVAVKAGTALRAKLGHYQGAMFYFDGEWFWGVDRIRLLEQRLIDEGFCCLTNDERAAEICVPEPTAVDTSGCEARHIVLEYFPSLRSPYSAIGHQRIIDLVERSGVTLKLRPVMPMLMRGIPAPFAKQQYIVTDSARESRARGIAFGHIVDPFGEPVKRAFALFPAALALGVEMDFVTAYLSAAWARGIDITSEDGLRQVVEDAGIDWDQLQSARQDTDWEALLEANLNAMLEAGLWGVPSFRVSGGTDSSAFACWGQDRIWRVENEIARRLSHATPM
jgi:2-hydroxychromene-2-carboxylate isomerase